MSTPTNEQEFEALIPECCGMKTYKEHFYALGGGGCWGVLAELACEDHCSACEFYEVSK